MSELTLRASRIFDGERVFAPGEVHIVDDLVVRVGPASDSGALDLGGVTVAPGLVDVHGHGGGGATYGDDPAAALAVHRSHGTTTQVASLVTQRLSDLTDQLTRLAPMVAAGELAGVHLEGPWLAPQHRGAHPAELLRDPAADEIAEVLDGAGGCVRMVTVAPELPGGLAAVELLARRGVVAAVGHSAADLATTRAAVAAGARGATHLFNGMPELAHRAPGPVLGLMEDDRVWLEIIADGVHVDIGLVAWLLRTYPERVVLITDAMSAAGQPDGDYVLGELPVKVRDGIARIASGALAGSTLTMAEAVRRVISAGVDWTHALRAATLLPARYLDLAGVGSLVPGAFADLVCLDDEWQVQRVLRRGVWLR